MFKKSCTNVTSGLSDVLNNVGNTKSLVNSKVSHICIIKVQNAQKNVYFLNFLTHIRNQLQQSTQQPLTNPSNKNFRNLTKHTTLFYQ